MKAIKGTVDAVYENSVNTARGPATTYAIKVDGVRYSAGFKELGCKEGDMVEFTIKESNGYWNVDGGVTVVGSAPTAPASTGSTPPPATKQSERERRITFLACRNTAIEFTKMAIEVGALKLPAKDKEEVLAGYVQKYGEEFFIQSWVTEDYAKFEDIVATSDDTEKQEEE